MSQVPIKSLADIAESVSYGYTASASDTPVGPHFLRITDIVPPQIDWNSVPYCEIEDKAKERFSLAPGDIVVARTGATVGYAKLIRDHCDAVFASYLVRIRVDPKLADPGYVGRIVESNLYKQFVASRVAGAAQPNANARVLSSFRLSIPDRATQARIVSVLSAYDDLIENNRRRIQLLEQSARLLYKEWFVHLRFPGHEHVKIKDGLPEGWKSLPLSACVTFQSGGTPSKANPDFWLGDIPWISSGELTGIRISTSKHRVTEEAVAAGSRFAELGTILGVVRGMSLAKEFRLGIAAKRVCFNQDLKAFVPDRGIESIYLFHALDEQRDRIRQQAGEASHGTKKLETAVLENLKTLVPAPLVRKLFVDYVSPLHSQMDVLIQQNRRLERARDLILPRLMSGRLAA